jgi:hypothetical protein
MLVSCALEGRGPTLTLWLATACHAIAPYGVAGFRLDATTSEIASPPATEDRA